MEGFKHWHIELHSDFPEKPVIQLAGYYAWYSNAKAVASAMRTEIAPDDCAIVSTCVENCQPTFNRNWMPIPATA